jgi:hypothetical protein
VATPRVGRSHATRPPLGLGAVVTHHRDGFRSGVARFNELLARELGVPLLGIFDLKRDPPQTKLLSFKVSELGTKEAGNVAEFVDAGRPYELYLHEVAGDELEARLIAKARRVHCGNHEILARVREHTASAQVVWTPGLILDNRRFTPSETSVFSFGMAHKIRTDMFDRLRDLLDGSGRSYAVYVSAANHETASIRDAQLVFDEMGEIFPRGLFFLGNLSDVAVFNYLADTTFFAAFFDQGVRANNTSVASAMERGAVVITNLDRHSPPEFVHMENLIDINRCERLPEDPLILKRLSLNAMELGRGRGWEQLVAQITDG